MSFFGDLFGKKKTANGPFGDVLEGAFSNLTTEQKCAIIAFESSVANFSQGSVAMQEAIRIVTIEMKTLNVKENQLESYARMHNRRVEDYVNGLRTITDKSQLDRVLYIGFGIASVCNNERALGYLLHVFEQLGYIESDVKKVIQKIELLGTHFNM